jgi:VWFA-related protein
MQKIRSLSFRWLVIVAVVPPLALPLPASGQGGRFQESTDVVVVEIPVQVTRDGEPVRGLSAADFEVIDGRKKQEIVGFDVVDLSQDGSATREIPIAGRRHFLMLFDLALSYPATVVKARDAARELVRNSLHPSDLVGVAVYSASRGAQLVLGFTSDRDQVDVAINTLGLPGLLQTRPDPLGLILADRDAFPDMFGRIGGLSGGGDIDGARNPNGPNPGDLLRALGEEQVRELTEKVQTAASQAAERRTVLALTSSLTELADMMSSIEGRKHVVFLSEGFESSSLLGAGVTTDSEQRRIQEQSEAAATGELWRVDPDARFGNTNSLNQLETMAQEFVRADCTIQAVDIGGLRAGADARARRSSDDGLYMMADKTGGEHYRNFNDLSAAMDKMLERTSVTYLLAIQPPNLKNDGDYHRLKVKVAAKGVDVHHRPGFFAPKPFGEQSAMERRFATAGLVLGGKDGGAIDTSVLAAPFMVEAERAYVPVLLEIDGPSLMSGNKGNVLPTELYAYAIRADGTVEDYFTQSLALDLSKAGAGLKRSGFKFWGYLELPAGEYTVRSVVRNGSTGAVGVRTADLVVPAIDRHEASLSPPFFPEPMGKWIIGQQEGLEEAGYDYPFLLDGQAFVPAARPLLQLGQASQISLVSYNLAGGDLVLSARLLDLDGAPVSAVEIAADGRAPGAIAGQERWTARVVAPRVASGRYVLEITAADAAGDEQRSTISVSVEG